MLVGFSSPASITTPPSFPSTRVRSDPDHARFHPSPRAEGTKLKPLRSYNSAVHSAAFVLPEFARQAVAPFVVPGTGF